MDVSIRREDLVRGLHLVQGVIERRNTLPILANVLLVPSHFLIFSEIATVLLKILAVVAPVADVLAELALVAADLRAILPDLVGASGLDVLAELLPVSREVPNASGKRHSDDMTLTPEERDIARRSIIDRPDLPRMTNAEKEWQYLQNRNRLRRMKADGSYSEQRA